MADIARSITAGLALGQAGREAWEKRKAQQEIAALQEQWDMGGRQPQEVYDEEAMYSRYQIPSGGLYDTREAAQAAMPQLPSYEDQLRQMANVYSRRGFTDEAKGLYSEARESMMDRAKQDYYNIAAQAEQRKSRESELAAQKSQLEMQPLIQLADFHEATAGMDFNSPAYQDAFRKLPPATRQTLLEAENAGLTARNQYDAARFTMQIPAALASGPQAVDALMTERFGVPVETVLDEKTGKWRIYSYNIDPKTGEFVRSDKPFESGSGRTDYENALTGYLDPSKSGSLAVAAKKFREEQINNLDKLITNQSKLILSDERYLSASEAQKRASDNASAMVDVLNSRMAALSGFEAPVTTTQGFAAVSTPTPDVPPTQDDLANARAELQARRDQQQQPSETGGGLSATEASVLGGLGVAGVYGGKKALDYANAPMRDPDYRAAATRPTTAIGPDGKPMQMGAQPKARAEFPFEAEANARATFQAEMDRARQIENPEERRAAQKAAAEKYATNAPESAKVDMTGRKTKVGKRKGLGKVKGFGLLGLALGGLAFTDATEAYEDAGMSEKDAQLTALGDVILDQFGISQTGRIADMVPPDVARELEPDELEELIQELLDREAGVPSREMLGMRNGGLVPRFNKGGEYDAGMNMDDDEINRASYRAEMRNKAAAAAPSMRDRAKSAVAAAQAASESGPIDDFQLRQSPSIDFDMRYRQPEYLRSGGLVVKDYRKGGAVKGPGTATSDSINARLSDGEYVVNAESMKIAGVPELLEAINKMGLQKRRSRKA